MYKTQSKKAHAEQDYIISINKLITMKRSVTVDFDKIFDDLNYHDQVAFITDKMQDYRLKDKLNIIGNALADVEIMDLIRQHRDTAIKVLRGEGFEIH